jgi:hypothetical protein
MLFLYEKWGLSGDGGRLDNGNTDLGETDLILGKEFGQDRGNGLRLPPTIFTFPTLVLVLVDAVFHDFSPLFPQNSIRL